MLKFEDITLDLKDEYRSYTKGVTLSGYSFSNIFMSRDCTYYKYARVNGGILVVCFPPGEEPRCLFPVGTKDLKDAVAQMRETFGRVKFAYLTYCMRQMLTRSLGEDIKFSCSLDNADYVYDVGSLIELSGKQYHGKKNFVNRFASRYDYEYIELSSENICMIDPLIVKWFDEHPGYEAPLFNERIAICELVHNFDALGLSGAAIKADDTIAAFTLGEQLTDDMCHILIEKGDTRFPGVYPTINRDFLEHRWSDMKLVNREEDMGLEGLRKAKQSYHPVFQNMVYSCVIE